MTGCETTKSSGVQPPIRDNHFTTCIADARLKIIGVDPRPLTVLEKNCLEDMIKDYVVWIGA